tara:strand:- start:224 stop:964 length:741 start_codon:yes stop_codon:yes gene_type:complete
MTTVAVIIARAGSEGLANKSLQLLKGKPVIAWTIEHALNCRYVDAIVLSSDCPRILAVGCEYQIPVYERPAHLATNVATIDAGVRHGIECWEHESGQRCSYVAILCGNVPIRPPDLTDRVITKLKQTNADSVQSVYPVGKTHPLWMRRLSGAGGDELRMYEPNRVYRRQDLPPVYMLDAGGIVVRRECLFQVDPAEPHAFLGSDRRAIVTQPGQVIDIDTELDLALAQVIMERNRSDSLLSSRAHG